MGRKTNRMGSVSMDAVTITIHGGRTMSELNLSMAEAVILQMGLRVLTQGDIKKTDRLIAEELDRKIRIAYKGQKIRLVLFGDEDDC